jgi:hypothetical protein
MGTDVDADVNVDVNVPPNINLTTTSDVDLTSSLTSSSVLDVRPLTLHVDPLSANLGLHVDPLQTSSKLDTDSSMTLDVRPLVLDVCAKLSVGPLPRACIRMPYGHRIGLHLFGVEVFGLSFQGESRLIMDDLRKVSEVAWGGESEGERHAHPQPTVAWGGEKETGHHSHHPPKVEKRVGGQGGGLRVRLD